MSAENSSEEIAGRNPAARVDVGSIVAGDRVRSRVAVQSMGDVGAGGLAAGDQISDSGSDAAEAVMIG
jgi:hypothetical protein